MLPEIVFAVSVAFNIAIRLAAPFLGRFRSGIDSLLFCAVTTGFLGGPKSGLLYGFLGAVIYYILASKRWDRAVFVVPMTALAGMFAGMLGLPLLTAGLVVFLAYHAVSFALFGVLLKNAGPGYAVFVILNFITTYALLQAASVYL